jgi:Mce-associated membrane protein
VRKRQADDDEPAGRRIGTDKLIMAGLVVALLAAVVTAGLQWYRADGLAEEEAERQRVAQRAGEFGKALLSYDHRDLKSARQKVMSLAAEDFAKTYDVAFTGGLEGVITRLKADATATVQTVYVNDFDDSTAKVVVVMDSEVRSTAGTRRVLGSYLEMRLAKQKDQWRITEVSSVGAVNESMTDPTGTAPKATPTPSPSG